MGLGEDPVEMARRKGHSGVVVMLEEARTGGRSVTRYGKLSVKCLEATHPNKIVPFLSPVDTLEFYVFSWNISNKQKLDKRRKICCGALTT